jgi:signal transduction histidine kinase
MSKHLFLFLLVFYITVNKTFAEQPPVAHKGFLDLSSTSVSDMDNIKLNGEWEFYWNRLYTPDDFKKNDSLSVLYINIPKSWNRIRLENNYLPSFGCATYRLRIKLNPDCNSLDCKQLGLYFTEAHSASKIWINGNLEAVNGIISDSLAGFKPAVSPKLCFFSTPDSMVEVVIQVANFFDGKQAGIDEPLVMGRLEQVQLMVYWKFFFYVISFGILLILGIYHLMLYWQRKQDKLNLYLGLSSIIFAFFTLWIGEKVVFFFIPNFPLGIYYRIWFSFLTVLPLIILYLRQLYPSDIPRWYAVSGILLFGSYQLAVIFLSASIYIPMMSVFLIIALIYILLGVCFLARVLIKKRHFSFVVISGILVVLVTATNDVLYALDWISTGYYAPFGFLACMISQSYIVSLRFSNLLMQVEMLTTQLEDANNQLEEKVKLRTEELNLANRELIELNVSKDKLFSIVSHDLKNPFSSITLISDLLSNEWERIEPKKVHHFLKMMHGTAAAGSRLLENLLLWSRLQTGKIDVILVILDISDIISEMLDLQQLQAENKNITLEIVAPKHMLAMADRNMLATVLRNLVSNSIKFTPRQGKIQISAHESDGFICIAIQDNGVGMTEDVMKKIFKKNEIVHTSGTDSESGSGLGLLLCKEFVKKMKGRIEVESEPNSGTCIKVFLPKAEIEASV